MKVPWDLKNESEAESYKYFDENIRSLPKDAAGNIDSAKKGFNDNDVDAFRHGYVSGVFTQEYGENAADMFGRLNESDPTNAYSNSTNPGSKNMDLWNNSVGRKYGVKSKDSQSLLENLRNALKNGELIIDPKDKRHYKGAAYDPVNKHKPIIVLQEQKKGRNEFYYDTFKKQILSTDEFINLIEKGKYPGYSVKNVHGIPTPVSNPDNRKANNLG